MTTDDKQPGFAVLSTNRYAEFVRVGNFTKNERDSKFLAAMGLSGEAGEVTDLLKKHMLHDAELDRGELAEELGDVLWYLQHACNVFGFTLEQIALWNMVKLYHRYPDTYQDILKKMGRYSRERT